MDIRDEIRKAAYVTLAARLVDQGYDFFVAPQMSEMPQEAANNPAAHAFINGMFALNVGIRVCLLNPTVAQAVASALEGVEPDAGEVLEITIRDAAEKFIAAVEEVDSVL